MYIYIFLIYEAQVVSVLLYNSSSWAAPKNVLEKIDICHRKHLRRILNLHWPHGVIKNKTLYKRCNCSPLSERVNKSRWSLLGHILRLPETTPAHLALHFALDGAKEYKGRIGRHQMNLLRVLRKDIEDRDISLRHALKNVRNEQDIIQEGMTLRDVDDLIKIRDIAKDRTIWTELFY